ncbi:MAG: hypothetical protein KBD00_06235 [Candidatus Peribacteraceae bacterium]|nr:hypothetical protein [Candidatus Peribacteraceae bacterium]
MILTPFVVSGCSSQTTFSSGLTHEYEVNSLRLRIVEESFDRSMDEWEEVQPELVKIKKVLDKLPADVMLQEREKTLEKMKKKEADTLQDIGSKLADLQRVKREKTLENCKDDSYLHFHKILDALIKKVSDQLRMEQKRAMFCST